MPTFTATEKNPPAKAPKPGEGPPVCPTPYLINAIDNIGVISYIHRHKTHTLRDILRPGYFNPLRETLSQQLLAGEAFIRCVLGCREDGVTVVNLHVIQAKPGHINDVLVAKGRTEHFTPCRHGGEALDDDDAKSTKAA